MKIYEKIKEWIYLLFDKIYVPEDLYETKGPLLLHISDTPEEIHDYIIKLVEDIKPKYIIHTGDLVDNIKLEITPNRADEYKEKLRKWINELEEVTDACIYYTIGNHDIYDEVAQVTKRGIPVIEDNIIIEGLKFYINHYHIESLPKVNYYLYGHSFEPHSYKEGNLIGLNGLNKINIIDLGTKRTYYLSYPFATNSFRKMENRKIGL